MVTPTRSTSRNRSRNVGTSRSDAGNENENADAPTLDELQGQLCPNCSVGVLYVIRYDPDSLHEVGQSLQADNQHESGGAYETNCFYCGQRMSHPMPDNNADGEG